MTQLFIPGFTGIRCIEHVDGCVSLHVFEEGYLQHYSYTASKDWRYQGKLVYVPGLTVFDQSYKTAIVNDKKTSIPHGLWVIRPDPRHRMETTYNEGEIVKEQCFEDDKLLAMSSEEFTDAYCQNI